MFKNLGLGAVIAAFAIMIAAATASAQNKIIMNIGYATSEAHPFGTFMNTFAERFTKLSGGAVEVRVHCCIKLGGEQDMFKKLQLGTLDGTLIAQNNAGPFYPKIDLLVLPYMLQSIEHALKVVDGPIGEMIWGDMPKEAGVTLVKISHMAFRNIYNSKAEINSIEDFRPLKYRVPKNVVMVDTYKAFGADPVPMAWSETLTALQTGTVDGGDLPIDVIYSQKFYEAAKNIAITEHFIMTPAYFVGNKFMEKLTPELREALQVSANMAAAAARQHTKDGMDIAQRKLEAAGVKFTYPDKKPFIEAAAKVHAAFAEKRGESYVKLIKAINEAAKN